MEVEVKLYGADRLQELLEKQKQLVIELMENAKEIENETLNHGLLVKK